MKIFKKKKKPENKFKLFLNESIFSDKTLSGKIFDIVLIIFILSGTLSVILETVDSISSSYGRVLLIVEWIVLIFFTAEYILRIYSSRSKKKYIFSFFGIIDFISIAPVYLSFFIPSIHFFVLFRAFRMIRVFRVFKMLPLVKEQNTLYASIRNSMPKILVFLTFTFISSVIFSSIMYIVEGPESGFLDIPTSLYWSISTITTVGYAGDIVPATALGRVMASIIVLLGYGIIAVPTGIVVSEYNKASFSSKKK